MFFFFVDEKEKLASQGTHLLMLQQFNCILVANNMFVLQLLHLDSLVNKMEVHPNL